MIEKIRALVEKHWDMVSYLFFGVLTTAVNYLVYLPLYNLLGICLLYTSPSPRDRG